MSRRSSPKVVIVGAGAAGIAAASKLVASNVCNVTILEAESRIGGRIYTSSFGEGIVELGAQWVHGEKNNAAHSLGTSAGLLSDDSYGIRGAKCVFSDGSVLSDEDADELFVSCIEVAHDDQKLSSFRPKGSLGDYFIESVKEKFKDKGIEYGSNSVESFLEWYHRFENSIDGSDSWFHTSAAGLLQYEECEGNSVTRWKTGGYKNIFKILMGNNCQKVQENIIFNKRVKTILWDQQPLQVICTDGQKFTADHVLLTVSLGVLKENHSSMFKPSLPFQKINTIQGLAIGTVDKIFIKFPYRWWPVDCVGFSLLWRKSDFPPENEGGWIKEVFGFYSVDDNPSVLCGWVVGVAARHMEQCSDDQVLDSCYQLLLRFLGSQYNIPPPDSILRSKWHMNPNFRGSYSFRSITTVEKNAWAADLASPLPHPEKPVLLFGGEATHDHFYSTVHGAIETGWREADRLISHLQNSLLGASDLSFLTIEYHHINNFQFDLALTDNVLLCTFAFIKSPMQQCPREYDIESTSKLSVIIVGAGMAGLGAAATFSASGIHNFLILEAQERAGGRVCSVPIDDTSQNYIELGAQWIHGERNPMFQLAKQTNLLTNVTSDEGQGMYLKPNGEELPLSLVQEVAGVVGDILEDCCQFVDQVDAPESLGDFLTTRFYQHLDSCNDSPSVRKDKIDLFDWHVRFQVIDNSCDRLNSLSARAWGLYEFCGGADYNNLRLGYSSLVQRLVDQLPSHSLRTTSVVKLVKYSSDQPHVKVFCENGKGYDADHVIVTSSLGYLKENIDTLFSPSLPSEISKTIHDMGFDTINKLFLVYDSEWWSSDFKGIQLIWDSEERLDQDHQSWLRHVTGFDVVATLQGVLLGWVGGEGALIMETLSDQDVSQHCTSVIRRFMSRHDIPAPDQIFRSKWHSNKFIRGGYSHTTNKCDKEKFGPEVLAQPVYVNKSNNAEKKMVQHPAVLLAGEAVHSQYFSTTHGAYMSGAQQAQLIVDYTLHTTQ